MSVYDTYDFVVTPTSSKQQLWESTGVGSGVRPVRYTYENVKVEVFTRGGEKVGFVAGSASFREGQREPLRDAACEINFARLVARHPDLRGELVVTGSFLEEAVRGKGVGLAMYRVLAEHTGKQGLAIVPEYCWSGTALTSTDALRVWGKLAREPGFDAEGHTVYAPPVRPNPSRGRSTSQTDTLTSSAAFRRWFGKSKVVNAKGEPRVMYHGTHADFDVFDTTGTRRARSFGAMFTPSKAYATNYGRKEYGGKVLAVYLRIENPFDAKNKKHDREWEANRLPQEGWVQYAHRAGYDGAITMLNEYVVFDPTQVKSATDNVGTFDPADPSILRNPRRRRAPHPQVGTPAFQRWFGNSRVVDAAGEPLVVYHGTCGDFSVFDPERADTTAGTGVPFGTFFFTSRPEVADTYARDMRRRYCLGGNIMPVYLSLQDPLIVDLTKWAHVPSWNRIPYRNREWTINTLTEHALRRGYDGLIVKGVWDTGLGKPRKGRGVGDTYVAFAPEQIKSAIGNRGTFDPDDADITRNNPRRRR